MNLSGTGASFGDRKFNSAKATLNPNAAEFVPFVLRSTALGANIGDASSKYIVPPASQPLKTVLDRSESSVSNKLDEEAKQYWRHRLPDDITLDFKVMGIDDSLEISEQPRSSMSSSDVHEGLRYSDPTGVGFMLKEQRGLSTHSVPGNRFAEKLKYPLPSYGEYLSPQGCHPLLPKEWDKRNANNDQLLFRNEPAYDGDSRISLLTDLSGDQSLVDNEDVNLLEILASQFPGFAVESLAEVYFANGGDLSLTIEMLTQLELQVDGGFCQTPNPKAMSAPNLSVLDFPFLSVTDGQSGFLKFSGDNVPKKINLYRSFENRSMQLFKSSSSFPSIGATDFTSVFRKMTSQGSIIWEYDRNSSSPVSIESSRSFQPTSMHKGDHGRGMYGNRLQHRGPGRASTICLETGEAVANMYSEMREEARDHACVRNTYFEQARQAYLIGNKALAKELSIKGQLHSLQMKAAQGKAQESIYRRSSPDTLASGQERMIDLHGLHVNEAIPVLKHEVAAMKNAAKSADQNWPPHKGLAHSCSTSLCCSALPSRGREPRFF